MTYNGLWYIKYEKPFDGQLLLFDPVFPPIGYPNGQPMSFNFDLEAEKLGKCPEVFWYQFLEHTSLVNAFAELTEHVSKWIDVAILKLCFFDSTTACVIFDRNARNSTAAILFETNTGDE